MSGQGERNEGSRGWPEWPAISERHWEALTLTSAIFTAVLFCIAGLYLFVTSSVDKKEFVTVFTPFGAFALAVVTFCSVNWRGKITTRQADVALRQINLAERESRAKLLQEGAKLLGEDNRHSHISAGIATLALLITGDDDALAIQAMNLVADFIPREANRDPDPMHAEEALSALALGVTKGRTSERSVHFRSDGSRDISWPIVPGVKRVFYQGGGLRPQGFAGDTFPANASFYEVAIARFHDVDVSVETLGCKFYHCRIRSIAEMWPIPDDEVKKIEFHYCDFSGAKIARTFPLDGLNTGKNYFKHNTPPSIVSNKDLDWVHGPSGNEDVDWTKHLRQLPTTS